MMNKIEGKCSEIMHGTR